MRTNGEEAEGTNHGSLFRFEGCFVKVKSSGEGGRLISGVECGDIGAGSLMNDDATFIILFLCPLLNGILHSCVSRE